MALVACGEGSPPGYTTAFAATATTAWDVEPGPDAGGSTETSSPLAATTAATGEPEPPACGDGIVDPGEGCDDGNADPGDGCDAACRPMATVEWTYTHNGGADEDDSAAGVAVDATGRVIVVGAEVLQSRDALILALAPDGGELWRRTIDAAGLADELLAVAIGEDGTIYAAGYEEIEAGAQAAVVRAFTAEGADVWKFAEEPPAPGFSRVQALTVADGALYSAGSEVGADPAVRLAIRRHAPGSGAAAWKTTTTAGAASARAGGIAAAGARVLAAGHVEVAQGMHPLLVWVDHAGSIASEAIELEQRGAWTGAAAIGGQGEVVLSGRLELVGGEFDVAARRIGEGGAVQWTRTVDHLQGFDAGLGVAVGAGEAVFVAGSVTTATGDLEIFGGRVDGDGSLRWTHVHANRGIGLDDHGAAAAFGPGFVVLAGDQQAPGEGANVWVRRFMAE